MSRTAVERLKQERKDLKRDPDRPIGWWTRLSANPDGSANFMKWECGLPGPKDTCWEGGEYRINMMFPEDYPAKVSYIVSTMRALGFVISILDEDREWRPSITIKQMLHAIFELLDNPDTNSPAQSEAYQLIMTNRPEYDSRLLEQARNNPPSA